VRRGFNEAHASRLLGAKVQVTGIDGLPLAEARDLFFSISKNTRISKLYLEINYLTSNDCEAINEYRPIEDHFGDWFRRFRPGDAVIQSIKTLRINLLGPRAFDGYFDGQGSYHSGESGGASQTGTEMQQLQFGRFFRKIENSCKRNPNNAADFKDLADIFKLAQSNHTDVVLLVLPASASWQARVRQAGLDPTIAQWKDKVSRQALQFHFKLLDYERHYDFPDFIQTSNDIPLFWDETHFSNSLGNRLLADIVKSDYASSAKASPAKTLNPGFRRTLATP
jgi:hypothetical protein